MTILKAITNKSKDSKKSYILPISQLDAVMISLDANDTDSKTFQTFDPQLFNSCSSTENS